MADAKHKPSPRRAVLDILAAILEGKQTFDDAFRDHAFASRLEERDRHFIHHLVFAVLRHKHALEATVKPFCKQPIPAKHAFVKYALWCGAAQLFLMKSPAHAVVHEWVECVKHSPSNRLSGMVNAILRRLSEQPDAWKPVTPPRGWLWERWEKAYGRDAAQAIVEIARQEPPLDIGCKSEPHVWAERLGGELLPTGAVRLREHGAVAGLPGYAEGAWWVQDAAAALPVTLLGAVRGRRVLDLCAAPGGKTAQLCAGGATVTAVDRSKSRMKRLAENMARLGFTPETVVADVMAWKGGEYEVILLDAPCTATGTIRRHPELPFLKTPDDVKELLSLQCAMLERAAGWLAPGGTLIYCVCSLQPEEGEGVVAQVPPSLRRLPFTPSDLPEGCAHWLTAEGDIRLLPHFWADKGGMDGFFIARMVKNPD